MTNMHKHATYLYLDNVKSSRTYATNELKAEIYRTYKEMITILDQLHQEKR